VGRVNSTRGVSLLPWEGPLYKANPDILYPVARALYQLVYQEDRPDARNIKVSVRFNGSDMESESYCRTRDGAKLAGKLMYDSAR
jgi:hypothetical protein